MDREIVNVGVTELRGRGKPAYGLHVEYEDGTGEDLLIGSRKAAETAAREAVEIGEAYIRLLTEDDGSKLAGRVFDADALSAPTMQEPRSK